MEMNEKEIQERQKLECEALEAIFMVNIKYNIKDIG